ncbi:uncharacterized protein KIAA1614 homolog [Tachyglossus aculeatus]|uniref:uncharacterized protein KIAA1614 homolog n=1 Tax=Tachyglossus aculeatus TaxID=9261 RepID=UPI0018F64BAF|nr:uncharacterized protein KIAA1614 homolog [Tachyglossus aculeatus]
METDLSAARRRSGKDPNQQGSRAPLRPPVCPQDAGEPRGSAPEPNGGWEKWPQGPSVLESKVRALKEKRMAGGPGAPGTAPQEWPTTKNPKARQGRAGTVLPAGEDVGTAPQAQVRSYLTEALLLLGNSEEAESQPVSGGVGPESPAHAHRGNDASKGARAGWGSCPGRSRSPLDPDWRQLQGTDCFPQGMPQGASPRSPARPDACGELGPIAHKPSPGNNKPDPHGEGLVPAPEAPPPGPALEGQLWQIGSWNSWAGSTCALSLADRVERNRVVLQETLSLAGKRHLRRHQEVGAPTQAQGGKSPELLMSDLDWDSGISLQDSDGCKACVPSQDLVLSPQQEQAKQLLQRGRMKARTGPLRASHDILPTGVPHRRFAGGDPALEPRMTSAPRDGDGSHSGNLSDSSSGESGCGQPWKRGLSPSRVRFEDESTRDAEVRYLDRMQQRQQRMMDLMARSWTRGPLGSKPDLSDYINGNLSWREGRAGGPGGRPPGRGRAGGPGRRDPTGQPPGSCVEKCGACGSYLQQSSGGDSAQEGGASGGLDRGSQRALKASKGQGSPGWVPPSQRQLQEERVQETYVGQVTEPEEADSALDSTDTSDGGRTDSEEAGVSCPRHLRSHSSCSRAPRAGETEPRGRDAELGKPDITRSQGSPPWAPRVPAGDGMTDRSRKFQVPRVGAIPEPPATMNSLPAGATWSGGLAHCEGMASLQPMPPGSSERAKGLGQEPPESIPIAPGPPGGQGSRAVHPTQKPAPSSLGAQGPAPPKPCRRAVLVRGPECDSLRPELPRDPAMARPTLPSSLNGSAGGEPTAPETHPSPRVRTRLRVLSTNNCNNVRPREQPDSRKTLAGWSPWERSPGSQEPGPPSEPGKEGELPGPLLSGATSSLNSTGITVSLATVAPLSNHIPGPEPERDLQGKKLPFDESMSPRESQGADPEPSVPAAVPARENRRGSGVSPALGLKKFFSALGQSTRQKLGRFRSYSLERIPPQAPDPDAGAQAGGAWGSRVKKAPSLQSLRMVSPFHQPRKGASTPSLQGLLGKADRSSLYLVGDQKGRPGAAGRRSLSVEDISAPNLVRTVGRVLEVFPDGTSQLQLQRPPQGTFGFWVSSGNGRPDTGFYIQEMVDSHTAKLYAGLLGVGDEILEVNGTKVTGLGLAHINELLTQADSLSIRVLRQRQTQR